MKEKKKKPTYNMWQNTAYFVKYLVAIKLIDQRYKVNRGGLLINLFHPDFS